MARRNTYLLPLLFVIGVVGLLFVVYVITRVPPYGLAELAKCAAFGAAVATAAWLLERANARFNSKR